MKKRRHIKNEDIRNQRKVLDTLFYASWKKQSLELMKQDCEKFFPTYSETAMSNDQGQCLHGDEVTSVKWQSSYTQRHKRKSRNLRQVKIHITCFPMWGKTQKNVFFVDLSWGHEKESSTFFQASGFLFCIINVEPIGPTDFTLGEFNPNCSTNKGKLKSSASIVTWVNGSV